MASGNGGRAVGRLPQHDEGLPSRFIVNTVAGGPDMLAHGLAAQGPDGMLAVAISERHEFIEDLLLLPLGAPRYLAPMASVSSLRVVMLIRLFFVTSRSRRTIQPVANYMRQQGISGNKSDESMRLRSR